MASLDPSGLLAGTQKDEDPNDITLLEFQYRLVYKNPHNILQLDEDASVSQVRDAYRQLCLAKCGCFSGLPATKMTLKQLTLAYYLCRKIITGTPMDVRKALLASPYLDDICPEDILPLLRPQNTTFMECPRQYRGFRQLAVAFVESKLEFGSSSSAKSMTAAPVGSMGGTMGVFSSFVRTEFTFDVHYCLRRHTVSKTYEDCYSLYEMYRNEMLSLPDFPTMSIIGIFDPNLGQYLGEGLAKFLNRIHRMISSKNLFSPLLLTFLDIPFERVQTEEEGRIIQMLDGQLKPPRTVSHIIDEAWLKRWRSFVMGRGARRYKAPGPITNEAILQEYYETKDEIHTLVAGEHYRCVNYNVWRFYELVHGGGPCISRLFDDIYSPKAQSILQAVIGVQKLVRIYLAKCKRYRLYVNELSRTDAGLEVVATVTLARLREKKEKEIEEQKIKHKSDILDEISRMTVAIWRSKKNYQPEGLLARRKEDQAVFARAPRSRGGVSTDDAIRIVQDLQPIIHLASTSRYTKRILEADGIKFFLAKFPGTEIAVVSNSKSDTIVDGSRVVSINGTPTSALSFVDTKQLLSTAKWPIDIVFEKPPNPKLLPKLSNFYDTVQPRMLQVSKKAEVPFRARRVGNRLIIARVMGSTCTLEDHSNCAHAVVGDAIKSINKKMYFMTSPEKMEALLASKNKLNIELESLPVTPVKNDAIKVTAVKLWLNHGIKLMRYPEKKGLLSTLKGSRRYVSTLRMTGTHLHFKLPADDKKLESSLWESISLFSIKFVCDGYNSEFFKKKSSKVDLLACFEIVTEENFSILFEIMPEKTQLVEEFNEFIAEETERALRYAPDTINARGFMRDLKKKYEAVARKPDPVEVVAIRRQKYCSLIVGSLKAIVEEMRGNKVFLGEDGIPVRRTIAKTILKKNDAI